MELLELQRSDPAFDVQLGHACRTPLDHYNFFGNVSNVDACEANCAADPVCQMFSHKSDTVAAKTHFCALYNQSTQPAANPSGSYDCGCRGKCPTSPGPPGPPSPPGPKPPKPGRCAKLQGWDYNDANISVTPNVAENNCCDVCNRTKGCAVSVWVPVGNTAGSAADLVPIRDRGVLLGYENAAARDGNEPNGTCITKSSRLQPINAANSKHVAWLPAGAPVPPPVIQSQAGLVVGDMKIITGQAINMAIFTGPQYPNASTPWTNNNSIKVPSFACSKPYKAGCLFNVTADPTEHNDLALERPELLASMLAQLRNISKSRYDPLRGPGDPRACVQMKKNRGPDGNKNGWIGFFGPWLELA